MKNRVAMQGKPLRDWTSEEKAVYELLMQERGNGPLSPLGLSRRIRKNPGLKKADTKIAAAADSLRRGMLIAQDEDGNYSIA